MKIYDILKKEHQEVFTILKTLHAAPPSKRAPLRKKLLDEMTAHSIAEDNVLYDRMEQALPIKSRDIILEAREEHLSMTRALEDLALLRVEDERFPAKVKSILDIVQHHVQGEEGHLFATARDIFDDEIAENFAGEYMAAKDAVMRTPLVIRFGKARAKKAIENVGAMLRPGAEKRETPATPAADKRV